MSLYVLTTHTTDTLAEILVEEARKYAKNDQRICGVWTPKVGGYNDLLYLQRISTLAELEEELPMPTGYKVQGRERIILREHRAFIPENDAKFYDFRVYNLASGKTSEWVDLILASSKHRDKYSRNYGIWSAVTGCSDTVFHLWGYDSLEHRDAVRAKVLTDKEWLSYGMQMSPIIKLMNSRILVGLH